MSPATPSPPPIVTQERTPLTYGQAPEQPPVGNTVGQFVGGPPPIQTMRRQPILYRPPSYEEVPVTPPTDPNDKRGWRAYRKGVKRFWKAKKKELHRLETKGLIFRRRRHKGEHCPVCGIASPGGRYCPNDAGYALTVSNAETKYYSAR